MRLTMTTIALAAAAGVAHAQYSQELGAGSLDEGAQIEIGGANTAPFFMNAQGNDGDGFSEFYVMRFDLSAYSGAAVDTITLDLRHEEANFAASGGVRISYSTDDLTALNTLDFDTNSVGGNNGQLVATEVAAYNYIDLPGDDTTTIDTITLLDAGGFYADVMSQGVVTLIFEATDPGTAALYSGIGNFGGAQVINVYEIPAPGAAALFGLAGLSAARRRR